MTYDTFDVVVVPFPFTDKSATKRRPALVVSRHESFSAIIEHSVLAMITRQIGIVEPDNPALTCIDTAE